MRQQILARLEHMAEQDALAIIPKDTIDRIKKTDPNPQFNVYVVGHEGTANASEINMGQRIARAFKYMGEVVVGIAQKLTFGTPIFPGHNAAMSNRVREQIGEVVGKSVRYVEGKAQALAAIYLYPQYRGMNWDIASIEADVEYQQGRGGSLDVLGVDKVTAIALGDSRTERPAFPGATLQAVVHAFVEKGAAKHMAMTAAEIRAEIRAGNIRITDIYDRAEILEAAPVKEAVTDAQAHSKRIEEQLGKERERIVTLQREGEEKDKKIGTLSQQTIASRARDMFTKTAGDRNLDDKQKAFIDRNLGTFQSTKDGAELETDFAKFIDGQLKSYDDTAKLFGVKPAEGAGAGAGAGGGTGAGAPATEGEPADGADLSNPKNNDLIPTS